MLLAKITNLLLLALLTLSTVTTHVSVSIINQKPLDPKEFACGNKDANAVECINYQAGQLVTGAILTGAIGLVIPKGATTKVTGVTQGIDDLKKVPGYIDDVDDVKVNKGNTGTDIDGIPCVSDSGNQNKSILDYALVIIGVKGLSVEAACPGGVVPDDVSKLINSNRGDALKTVSYKTNNNKIVWLEKSRLDHLKKPTQVNQNHITELNQSFFNNSASEQQIINFVTEQAFNNYVPGKSFSGNVNVSGKLLHLEIGDNGYIVTAYPIS
jgi:hypothetical protein